MVPMMKVVNSLKSIGRNPITYENYFPLINQALLSEMQVKYVQDVIVTRDMVKLGM